MRKIFNILFFYFLAITFLLGQSLVKTRVSYKCLNKPLSIVLREVSKSTGVNIVFANNKLKTKKTVTISSSNEELGDFLDIVLEPYRLTYEQIDNTIVIVNQTLKGLDYDYFISGYIRDKTSGEALPYATSILSDNSAGVYANEKGFYSLKLKRGTHQIIYSYLGFVNDTISLYIKKDSTANINLQLYEAKLNEVTVTEDLNRSSFKYGEDYFSNEKLYHSTTLLGEADVMKSITTLAGISSGADGFGGLSVRGGNTDQNLILYDGVPVQNNGHAFGLISIFNPSIVKEVRLLKNAIPARFGGRLSSFMDIKTKDGNNKKFGGEVGLSTIASHATLEGPIIKDKASFIVSYRRTFADPIIKSVSNFINQSTNSIGSTSYFLSDLNAKLAFQLNTKHQLSVSYYTGKDELETYNKRSENLSSVSFIDQNNNQQSWGNDLISLHLNSQIGKNQYSKFTVFQSKWNSNDFNFKRNAKDTLGIINDIFVSDLKHSQFNVKGIKWDYDIQFKSSNIMRFGLAYNKYDSEVAFKNQSNLNSNLQYPAEFTYADIFKKVNPLQYNTQEYIGYIEEEISSGKSLNFNIGLHTSVYKQDSVYIPSFQPRASLTLNGEFTWFNIAASVCRQYQQALSENGLGFPSELWAISTKGLKPAKSLNFSSNLGFMLSKNTSLNFGAYYKQMSDIISLGEGQTSIWTNDVNWTKFVPFGKGNAYGGEVTFSTDNKFVRMDVNFTLSKSTRDFEDLNNGKQFLYKFDRLFMSNANLGVKLGKNTDITLIGTYQEGSKVTFPTGGVVEAKTQDGQSYLYPIYTAKNNSKFRDYIRLDASFNYVVKSKIGQHRILFGVYNILDRKNPLYLQIKRNTYNLNSYEVNQVSVMPLLPALSYLLTF